MSTLFFMNSLNFLNEKPRSNDTVRIRTVYGPYRSTWEVCLKSLFTSYSNSSNNDCQLLWNLTPIDTTNRKIYNNHCLRQVLLFNECLNICMHIKISSVTKWIQDHRFDRIYPRRNIKNVQHLSSWFHIVKPPNKLAEVYYLWTMRQDYSKYYFEQ